MRASEIINKNICRVLSQISTLLRYIVFGTYKMKK